MEKKRGPKVKPKAEKKVMVYGYVKCKYKNRAQKMINGLIKDFK